MGRATAFSSVFPLFGESINSSVRRFPPSDVQVSLFRKSVRSGVLAGATSILCLSIGHAWRACRRLAPHSRCGYLPALLPLEARQGCCRLSVFGSKPGIRLNTSPQKSRLAVRSSNSQFPTGVEHSVFPPLDGASDDIRFGCNPERANGMSLVECAARR